MAFQNRSQEVEFLRAFAILAVISIHTFVYFTEVQGVNLLVITTLLVGVFSEFAVPLFIFISGFVLYLNYNSKFSQYMFYKKRVDSILLPYIVFSTLYTFSNIAFSAINGKLKIPSTGDVIFHFLTASSSVHLWFIALIFQFYIFYPYLTKLYEKFLPNYELFFIGATLVIQQLWLITKAIASDYFISSTFFNSYAHLNTAINTLLTRVFLSYIFYFILGVYVSKNYDRLKDQIVKERQWIFPIILIFTGTISVFRIKGILEYGSFSKIPEQYFIVPYLIQSIFFPLIFLIFFRISFKLLNTGNKYSNTILSVGKYSFGIYLIHILYLRIIKEIIFPKLGIYPNHWIFYPVLFMLTLSISYFSVHLIANSRYGRIVGVKSDR